MWHTTIHPVQLSVMSMKSFYYSYERCLLEGVGIAELYHNSVIQFTSDCTLEVRYCNSKVEAKGGTATHRATLLRDCSVEDACAQRMHLYTRP